MSSGFYFAYGSNMSTRRLQRRVRDAVIIGTAEWAGQQPVFDTRSQDGSGKANLLPHSSLSSWGVLFELRDHHWETLDAFEPGYSRLSCRVTRPDGVTIAAQTYLADIRSAAQQPHDWYLDHILVGAREHELPPDYIERLAMTETVVGTIDPEAAIR